MVDHLHLADTELFITRWLDGSRLQLVQWPRGFFKTTTFTISTGMWIVLPCTDSDTDFAINRLGIPEAEWLQRMRLHDQDATQLYAFETMDNAMKKLSIVREHFENNDMLRHLFPEIAYTGEEKPWNERSLKIRRAGARRYDAEGTFDAIGVGTSLQSRHYKVVWCDDLVGEDALKSPTVMQDTIGWFQRLAGAFEQVSEEIRFVVGNQWGYNDLNAWIKKNEPDFVIHTRSAWEIGADGKETAVFPERMDMAAIWARQKKMKREDFAAQYMNRAVLPGEEAISLDLIHRYTVDADGYICCSCGTKVHPGALLRWMHYDPYNAKLKSTSRPAIIAVGTSFDKHAFVLHYAVARERYAEIFDRIIEMNDRFRPQMLTYEDVGAQNMAEFYLKERQNQPSFEAAGHRRFPRIKPIPTKNKPKEVRIQDYVIDGIQQEGLKISCRNEHLYLLNQFETFPHPTFDHDYDLLDCLAQGTRVWRYPVDEETEEQMREKEQSRLKELGAPYSQMRVDV